MADSDEWTSDANKALTVSILQFVGSEPKPVASFHPRFTYPIFGDAQTIWGYRGLQIELRFTFHDLRSNLKVSWDAKHETVGETTPLDIRKTLKDWLPEDSFGDPTQFEDSLRRDLDGSSFSPPGQLLTRYRIGDRKFEVWHASLKPKNMQELFSRMQIFTPLFIEGGTYINLDDPEWSVDRWRVFLLYEKIPDPTRPNAPSYLFMGYSTVYRYPYLPSKKRSPQDHQAQKNASDTTPPFEIPNPGISPVKLPCRQRISQFLILPAYQHKGHGAAFYSAIFNYFLASPNVYEVTIEDPNESFDDLRDYCDLARLRKRCPEFTRLQINHTTKISRAKKAKVPTAKILLPASLLEFLRQQTKIAPRQFARLVEMHLLSLIPKDILQLSRYTRRGIGMKSSSTKEQKAYRLWRLLVKQRIYKRNSSLLTGMDFVDRAEKLDDTLDDLEADYVRILESAERPGIEDEQLQPIGPVGDEEEEGQVQGNGRLAQNEMEQQVESPQVQTEDEASRQLQEELREWNERIARKQQARQSSSATNNHPAEADSGPPAPREANDETELSAKERGRKRDAEYAALDAYVDALITETRAVDPEKLMDWDSAMYGPELDEEEIRDEGEEDEEDLAVYVPNKSPYEKEAGKDEDMDKDGRDAHVNKKTKT
ncbi:MAG: histone acetyltransferase 1 [Peltula sp. TS41687]|nr:MAG: histone acetyltransferase 1 [Peltula sp. TS41687]